MGKQSFKTQLKAGNKAWKESADTVQTLGKIEAGEYVAELTKAELKTAQTSGNLMVSRSHIITEGNMQGKTIYDNLIIETPIGMAFLRKWFEAIQVEIPENIEDVEQTVSDINDNGYTAKINVRHSGDFTNVDILEYLEGGSATEEAEEAEDTDEGSSDEVDLDEMDKDEMLELIDDEDITIKGAKKMTEKKLRKAIEKVMEEAEEEDDAEEDSEDKELLERAEKFCIAQDLDYDEDDVNIDDMKDAISEEKYRKKDLDDDDIDLLNELGLKKLIKGK